MQHFPYLAFCSSGPVTGLWCHSGDQTPSTVPLHINDSLDHIYSFLPAFSSIFALITIFGNGHRPHQQCPNIVKKSSYYVYYFS